MGEAFLYAVKVRCGTYIMKQAEHPIPYSDYPEKIDSIDRKMWER